MSTNPLHPDAPLLRQHFIDVGDGHVLNVQEFGAADGIPAVVLHGGPGSGCSPLLRRFFDPARYRIVCIDQRGAGGSGPHGSIANNTTANLLNDLHAVRERLGLRTWLVVGGSWGATLALAHAAAEPEVVSGLLLRSTFLARREDVQWFFQGAAARLPRQWACFAAVAPPDQRGTLLPWLGARLHGPDADARRGAALAWWHWERALGGAAPAADPDEAALAALIDRYRVQSHYLLNDCWLAAPSLLELCERVPRVPTLLLHARDDAVCRPEGALALQARLPHSKLEWSDHGGHDPAQPVMAGLMVDALERFASTAAFGARA